ncbi:hypothetical protein [Desulfocurvus sp. DL9XJH121]
MRQGLRLSRLWALALILALILAPRAAWARDVVSWPCPVLPPLFVAGDAGEPGGYGPIIQRALQQALPEYEHQPQVMSFKRIFLDAKRGERMVLVGLFKTRSARNTWSIPPCPAA